MNILGISALYHDSASSLVMDGKLIAAAEEERFSRKKHDSSFPEKSAKYCLGEGGISAKDLDYIVFYEKPLLKFERLLSQHLQMFPHSFPSFAKAIPSWMTEKLRIPSLVRTKLGYDGEILYMEHHMSHAASAFLVSPFEEAAIITTDGLGEWTSTTYGYGQGNDINLKKEIHFPSSLGLLYSTVTAHLGFSVNNSEYKVMGLAAYGVPRMVDKFEKLMDIKVDGSFEMDMDYFDYHYKLSMPSKTFIELFGPTRKAETEVTQKHKDEAASLQKVTENILIKIANHVHDETGFDNLVMAGGVALNSVANGKILSNTPFKDIWIQPAASDAGGSVGAAFYIYNTMLGNKRTYVMDNAYHGPSYSGKQIEAWLKTMDIIYSSAEDENDLVLRTAQLIFEDNVVGWFQGRMEWGPRALGSRSILSNPANPEMQEILNLKVKHREKFRPFAPVVCEDDALTYFECDEPVPAPTDFMLMVYPIKKEWHKKIPAVTHVDGSGRLQTIRRNQNPTYYDLIKKFGDLSGIPILINTSFNIRGEPIVCRPEEAYRCMMGTGIDYLVMDRFIISREDNPKDMWDSESIAKD
ncbi:MAG: carbamoyltransferase [Candidatus Altiarchaeota archaeon]